MEGAVIQLRGSQRTANDECTFHRAGLLGRFGQIQAQRICQISPWGRRPGKWPPENGALPSCASEGGCAARSDQA